MVAGMTAETPMLRYSAHLPLTGIGADGQQRIRESHVALIGVGGLGCAAAQYLVSSGVGKLTLCDFDTVTESNLSRQILYRTSDLGRSKVEAAIETLQSLNPDTEIQSVAKELGIAVDGWHRALNDVIMTQKIFEHFLIIFKKDGVVTFGDMMKKIKGGK